MTSFIDTPPVIFLDTLAVIWSDYPIPAQLGVYAPIILLDLELDSEAVDFIDGDVTFLDTTGVEWYQSLGTKRFGTRTFYDNENNEYVGTIIDPPEVTKSLSGIFYGVEQGEPVTVRLSDADTNIDKTWSELVATRELRGKPALIKRYDDIDGMTYEFRGKISDYNLEKGSIQFTIESRDDEILDTLLPKAVVTTDLFHDTALDVGAPVNLCFGWCRDVFLPNIKNDTQNNHYDYLIGYGEIEDVWEDAANGIGVKRNGVIVNTAEYTIYNGSQGTPYPGYAFIRFIKEQIDFGGTYYSLTADIKGLILDITTAQRNPAMVIQYLLNNSIWGLNDSVDTNSFVTASEDLALLLLYCGGASTQQQQTRDILDKILFQCRGSLERNAAGGWTISIDAPKISSGNFGDNDGYYNNVNVISVNSPPVNQCFKKVIVQYAYNQNQASPYYSLELSVRDGFGVEHTEELPFVYDVDTAKLVLSYLKNRSIYDKMVEVEAGMDGRKLKRGDIISLTAPLFGFTAKQFKIDQCTRGISNFRWILREYDAAIFNEETITSPTARTMNTKSTVGPQSWTTSEYQVEAIGATTLTNKIKVWIDGVLYRVLLGNQD